MNPRLSSYGKTFVVLLAVIFTTSIMHQLFLSNWQSSEIESEEESEEKETGVDKQLSAWFQAKAYPDPYFLNDKYAAAWQHARAMRTPGGHLMRNNFGARINMGNWSSLNGPAVGRVLSIAINPTTTSTVFIGTASGGIWKSTNSGTSWSFVPTQLQVLGVPTIVFHPSNANILLAGTGEVYRADTSNIGYNVWKARGTYGSGIIRSTDGGSTWTQVLNKSMSNLFGVQMIKFDPTNSNIVYACTTNGLYKSTDAGATWGGSPVLNKIYVSDVVVNSGDNNQIMAAVGNLTNSDKGIYRTTDGGSNWTKISSAAIPTTFSGFSRFAYLSGNTVYITMGRDDAGENEIFKSTDFGGAWSSLNNSHHCTYQFWFANTATILPSKPDTLFIAGVNFYQYRVSTTTRTQVGASMHADFHDIKFDPSNSSTAYIASDGGMFKTTDATVASPTFTEINTGLNIGQFYASFAVSSITANRYIGGLQDNGAWSYDGASWTKRFGGDGGTCIFDPSTDNNVYASNDARKVNKSTTGVTGAYSIVLASWAVTGDDRTAFMTPLAISKSNPSVLYAASDNLHKTSNGGTSWTNNTLPISTNTNYMDAQYKTAITLAVSPTNENKLYVSTSPFSQRTDNALNITGQPAVLKTINGGSSFTNITTGLPQRFAIDFAISPTNDDSVFVVLGGFGSSHVYVSGNGGSSWADAGTGLPDVPFNAIVFDPVNTNIIYAGCDLGVYVSPDRGASWYDFNTGMADTDPVQVFDLQISSDNKIVAATHGRSAYRSELFNPATLPVLIKAFTGKYESGMNKLQWIVEQESNIRQYEVERSINGNTYSRVAIVNARNYSEAYTYRFNDAVDNMQDAKYYYRLKVVEMDGSFRYSSVVAITVTTNKVFDILTNPVQDVATVSLMLDRKQTVAIKLHDMKGSLIRQSLFSGQQGNNIFKMNDFNNLSKGIYIIEVVINNRRYSGKLVKK